jgi:hypothetical protein
MVRPFRPNRATQVGTRSPSPQAAPAWCRCMLISPTCRDRPSGRRVPRFVLPYRSRMYAFMVRRSTLDSPRAPRL